MKSILAGFLSCAALAAAFTPARADCIGGIGTGDLVEPGKLLLSINPTNPPQQFIDADGKLRGLNVEFADEIAKRICLPVDLVRMDFPGMIPAVKAGRLDGLDTGMFFNEERSKILYMVPYGVQAMSVIVAVDGKVGISGPADLSGKSVAVENNSYQQKWLTSFNADQVAKGAQPITIRSFDTATDVAGVLLAGQVDGALLIDSVARSLAAKGRVKEVATGLGENRMSMGFRNKAVADTVVKALGAMQADGTYTALFQKFGLTPLPNGQAVAIVGPGPDAKP